MPQQHRDFVGQPVIGLQYRTPCAEICTATAELQLALELCSLPLSLRYTKPWWHSAMLSP